MDALPLDLARAVYKLAHRDIIANIPTAHFYFHVNAKSKLYPANRYSEWSHFVQAYESSKRRISSAPSTFVFIDLCNRIVLANEHFSDRFEYKCLVAHLHAVFRSTSIKLRQAEHVATLAHRLFS